MASQVRLLFDENLPARLIDDVQPVFPGSAHLETLGLLGAADRLVWQRAAEFGFVLVTKDGDFHRMSVLHGPPPKVLWIRLGNCSRAEIARLIVAEAERILDLVNDTDIAFLALGR